MFFHVRRFAMLAVLIPVPAAADYTGNQIHTLCQSNIQFLDGYVAGVMDKARQDWTHVDASVPRPDQLMDDEWSRTRIRIRDLGDKVLNFCPPEGSKLGQAVDIVCKSLRENPADRHKTAAYLAGEALKTAWACPR